MKPLFLLGCSLGLAVSLNAQGSEDWMLFAGGNHQLDAGRIMTEIGRDFADRFHRDSLLSGAPVRSSMNCKLGLIDKTCAALSLSLRTELVNTFVRASGGRIKSDGETTAAEVVLEAPFKHRTSDTVRVAVWASSATLPSGQVLLVYSLLPRPAGRWMIIGRRESHVDSP